MSSSPNAANARDCILTVITPTIGRPGLRRLFDCIDRQTTGSRIFHIVLWDDQRAPGGLAPESCDGARRLNLRLSAGFGRNGNAPGSPLRAVGLMAASTPWVTFADDDVWWDDDHAESQLMAAEGRLWSSSLRRIVSPTGEQLGVDEFESVGDDPRRRVPYEMCDGNCMMFRREFGVLAAAAYRETVDYDDDRRMYAILKQHAGPRANTGRATIEQTCPPHLEQFFRANCSPLPLGKTVIDNMA